MLELQRAFYGGQAQEAAGPRRDVHEPATGRVLCQAQDCDADDVKRAVEAAQEGFAAWSAQSGAERGRVLWRAAATLRERLDELARLEARDTGKPVAEALGYDVLSAAEALEFFAGLAPTLRGEHVDLGAAQGGACVYTRREPLGVCAGIGAWNFPLQVAAWKAAPALACGNALVYKPSELTPLTTLVLAEVLHAAGLPAGAFNVVLGGGQVGRALCEHPAVAKVSLTGGVDTGRRVMAAAAATLKPVTLELGGKSPLLVFADADLDAAVAGALNANFTCQGEVCTNGTRVFVAESLRDAFLERLLTALGRIQLGDPLDPQTTMGALISAEHRARVEGFVERAVAAGATRHQAGALPSDPALADGYWTLPCVLDGLRDDMEVVQEEVFGPVLSLLTFRDEDEVVARANATPFGLAAGLYTRDVSRAHRVAARLQAGVVWINDYNLTPLQMPFGGVKSSGLGRENGHAVLEHYTQLKSVYVGLGTTQPPF